MKKHGARTGRLTLASTSWLLLLAGLSCKYNVTLPWVADGASGRPVDTSFDHSAPSSPDTPSPDTRGCTGNYRESVAHWNPLQIIVAIDRSASMQKEFDSSNTKVKAAWDAYTASSSNHAGISFIPIWFPWTNCGALACCASPVAGRVGAPDGSLSCGPFEPGCLPSSKDSPSHSALQKAITLTRWGLTSTMILITDQNPSCAGDSPDINACDVASNLLGEFVNQPTRTYVLIPSAEETIPDCFSRIKQKPRDVFDLQISTAGDSLDLSSQLEDIVRESEKGRCRFYLRDSNLADVDQIRIGGGAIPREGWQINSGAIELSDEFCKNATSGNQQVKARVCNNGPGWP